MKWIVMFQFMFLLSSIAVATDHVVISEVLFWANGTDTGGEFVELYNPTEQDVDISGWTLATESSETDATIPENITLLAHHFYLIADAGWDSLKDNPDWPSADHEETITLSNADSGIALVSQSDIVDAAGWGDPSGIEEGKYEGAPFPEMAKAWSLERKPGIEDPEGGNGIDTDENSADFLLRIPEPQGSGSEETPFAPDTVNNFSIQFTVSGNGVDIISFSIEDDGAGEGIQAMPFPGESRNLSINATVLHAENVTVSFLNTTVLLTPLNETHWRGKVALPFFSAPGNHSLSISAQGAEGNDTNQTRIDVLEVAALGLDSAGMTFAASPGESFTAWGDDDITTDDRPTVRNIGNVPLDLKAKGTSFSNGEAVLPPEISGFNLNMSQSFTPLSESWATVELGMAFGDMLTAPLSVRLDLPADAEGGTYIGSMLLSGVKAE
ncbi:MAG: lamin tail domain-containing protein [Nanoarchaeota archaeon]